MLAPKTKKTASEMRKERMNEYEKMKGDVAQLKMDVAHLHELLADANIGNHVVDKPHDVDAQNAEVGGS